MDNKGIQRTHDAGFESQHGSHTQQAARRPPRKPAKKSNNVLCEVRGHHIANHEHIPLFNNRSLSILSSMHHLNPHRKVALSPEILREAEEQATILRKAVKTLQEQLEKTSREKARIHRFLSDLLYTLNARGYESVQDHEGTVVDLNKCKGESYLDLKGRDLKQRVSVRRPGGQELLMKAVIGNQERAIQSLLYKLDSVGRDMILGNRLSVEDSNSKSPVNHANDNGKVASLEAEILQLVNMIEGACQRCPEMYSALRDHYYLNDSTVNEGSDLSPRNPVIHNLLRKCEQIACEAQSRQLVDMLVEGAKARPKSPQNLTPTNSNNNITSAPPPPGNNAGKGPKRPTSSKSKTPVVEGARVTRSMSSELGSIQQNNNSPTWPQADFHNGSPHSEECLKPLNGGNRSDNSVKPKGVTVTRFTRPPHPPGLNQANENSSSAGDLASSYGSGVLKTAPECSVTVCPYCHRRFGLEESISEIKSHIEMHIFAGNLKLALKSFCTSTAPAL